MSRRFPQRLFSSPFRDPSDRMKRSTASVNYSPAPIVSDLTRKSPSAREDWSYLSQCSSDAARRCLPLAEAQRLLCLPLSLIDEGGTETLTVLIAEEQVSGAEEIDFERMRELRFLCGRDVIVETAPGGIVERAILKAYHGSDDRLRLRLEKAEASVGGIGERLQLRGNHDLAPHSEDAVPLLLAGLLERAESLGASDIHLEPTSEGLRLRFRIDGRLRIDTEFSVSRTVGENLLRRIKLLCQLDTTGVGRPQEGGFPFPVGDRMLRLRVSFIPQHFGEKAVLRLLESRTGGSGRGDTLAELGLSSGQERLLRMHLGAASGAILLAGPTGSGKSTLLYAALEHLNAEWRNIVTLEDPVERTLPGINQIEVKKDAGQTFSQLLASLLRQDPDVMMVGEIRDRETGQTALTAAITGHLVLSSVHAGSAVEILPRLLQLGIDSQLLSCSLRLLSAQRLLPLNCTHCRKRAEISEMWRRVLMLGDEYCYSSPGCSVCRGTGVRGRIGVYEFLPLTVRAREALWEAEKKGAAGFREFAQIAREEGYEPLAFAAREAILRGDVSPEKALRALGVPVDLHSQGGISPARF